MAEKIVNLADYKRQIALAAYKKLSPAIKEHILNDHRNFQSMIQDGVADIPEGISFSDLQEAVRDAGFCSIENTGILQHIYPIMDKNYFSPYDRRVYEEKIELLPGKIMGKLSDSGTVVRLDSSRLNLVVESSLLTTSEIDKIVRSCFESMGMDCPTVIRNPG